MSASSVTQLFATDQEIYDLIMSSPRRMSEATLLELLADRGVICSSASTREELASTLASLIHDYHDLAGLVQKGEHGRRNERTTFIELYGEITPEEIRSAVRNYQDDAQYAERLTVPTSTKTATRLKLDYDEIDYSRTRLIQRQRRQADFDIRVDGGKTRMRLPATEKARAVAAKITNYIEQARKSKLVTEEVSVADLMSPALRNSFFMRLIANIPDCRLQMVTDARVARWKNGDADEGDLAEARRDIMHQIEHQIESVSMRGRNIVLTPEYQEFLNQGFFLTSITWRSENLKEPHDLLQFEVAFEDGHAGTGFRYAVRQSAKTTRSTPSSFSIVPDLRKPALFKSVEEAARHTVDALRAENAPTQEP